MQAIKVLNGDTLTTLVDENNIFEAADLNGIGITDDLASGEIISVPDPSLSILSQESIDPIVKVIPTKSIAGQTWVDMAMQCVGDEETIFDLCDANDAGITDDLEAGTAIAQIDVAEDKVSITHLLKDILPSSLFFGTGNPAPEGIEFWAIEIDFQVS